MNEDWLPTPLPISPPIPSLEAISPHTTHEYTTPVPIPATPMHQHASSEMIHKQSPMYVGQRLGKYQIHDQIGRGSMSWVFRATNTLLDMPVALKVMHPSVALFHKHLLALFTREARLTLELSHPHIVRVYDFDTDQGAYMMAMEYVPGMTSGDVVAALGPMGEAMAMRLALQITDALQYAHRQNVIHRDIKPSNILIGKGSMAKLTDFGLARVSGRPEVSQEPTAGKALGTPNYWAPEQIMDASAIDHRADFYSLGATLFELLTGILPYRGRTALETSQMHLSQPVPDPRQFNSQLSASTATLVMGLMEKNPDNRPKTHEDIIAAVRAIIG
ncbi:protein kinase [bacterium]|nr:protein kinase [bacterium]